MLCTLDVSNEERFSSVRLLHMENILFILVTLAVLKLLRLMVCSAKQLSNIFAMLVTFSVLKPLRSREVSSLQ